MRIAILTSSFPLDPNDPAAAAGLFVRDFAIALAQQGPEVHVVTQDKGWGCKATPPEISVHCYPWPGKTKALSQLKLYRPADLYAAFALIRNGKKAIQDLHRQHQFDHVLAMWAVPAGLFARHLMKKSGIPYSVWCLGSDIWTYGKIPVAKLMVSKVIAEAEVRFADGIALAKAAERLSGKPIEFLPSSRKVDPAFINPAFINPVSLETDTPRYLFLGRYAQVKGVDVLLRAWAQFRTKTGRGSLYLLGGGPMESEIPQLVKQLSIQDSVRVGGYADLATFVSYASACDAMLIPSRMESIPVVLSDAAQLGKPVIVSDVGDMGTVVQDSGAGLVVPPGDEEALANALLEIWQTGFESFAEGVARLAARFDVNSTAQNFLEQIDS